MENAKRLRIHNKKAKEERLLTILFLGPAILLILCITVIPIFYAVQTSLHDTYFTQIRDFIGLENYKSILGSAEGWQAIGFSVVYVLSSLAIVIPVGTLLAILLNRKMAGRTVLRTVIIIPWVLSQTVTALLWKWTLNSDYGPASYLFNQLTNSKLDLLGIASTARLTVIIANAWNSFPIVLILVLAALQSISPDIYEAAAVDGATGFQAFYRITLPLLKPTILTAIVLQSMEYFNMVTLIFTMTNGGPLNATQTVSVMAYKQGFSFWHLGYGSAASIIILLLNMLFSVMYMRILRKKD